MTAKEQPEVDGSVTKISTIKVKVTKSELPQFVTTPSPAYAFVDAKLEWTFPEITNPLLYEFALGVESGPAWATYKSKTRTFTFDLRDQEGISTGDEFEIEMSFNLESTSVGSFFGLPSNSADSSGFNQAYFLTVILQEQADGLYL